jgi:hypothetical protein
MVEDYLLLIIVHELTSFWVAHDSALTSEVATSGHSVSIDIRETITKTSYFSGIEKV